MAGEAGKYNETDETPAPEAEAAVDTISEDLLRQLEGDSRFESGVPGGASGGDLDFIEMSGMTAPPASPPPFVAGPAAPPPAEPTHQDEEDTLPHEQPAGPEAAAGADDAEQHLPLWPRNQDEPNAEHAYDDAGDLPGSNPAKELAEAFNALETPYAPTIEEPTPEQTRRFAAEPPDEEDEASATGHAASEEAPSRLHGIVRELAEGGLGTASEDAGASEAAATAKEAADDIDEEALLARPYAPPSESHAAEPPLQEAAAPDRSQGPDLESMLWRVRDEILGEIKSDLASLSAGPSATVPRNHMPAHAGLADAERMLRELDEQPREDEREGADPRAMRGSEASSAKDDAAQAPPPGEDVLPDPASWLAEWTGTLPDPAEDEPAEPVILMTGGRPANMRRHYSGTRSKRSMVRLAALSLAVAALIVAGVAGWQYAQPQLQGPGRVLAGARQAAAEGDPLESARRYQTFVTRFPNHPEAPSALFQAALMLQAGEQVPPARLSESLSLLERFRQQYPEDERTVRAIILSGITEHRLGNHDAAIDALMDPELRLRDPEASVPAWRTLAEAHRALGNVDAAQSAYLTAASLRSNLAPDLDYREIARMYQSLAEEATDEEQRTALYREAEEYLEQAARVPGIDGDRRKRIETSLEYIGEKLRGFPGSAAESARVLPASEMTSPGTPAESPEETGSDTSDEMDGAFVLEPFVDGPAVTPVAIEPAEAPGVLEEEPAVDGDSTIAGDAPPPIDDGPASGLPASEADPALDEAMPDSAAAAPEDPVRSKAEGSSRDSIPAEDVADTPNSAAGPSPEDALEPAEDSSMLEEPSGNLSNVTLGEPVGEGSGAAPAMQEDGPQPPPRPAPAEGSAPEAAGAAMGARPAEAAEDEGERLDIAPIETMDGANPPPLPFMTEPVDGSGPGLETMPPEARAE